MAQRGPWRQADGLALEALEGQEPAGAEPAAADDPDGGLWRVDNPSWRQSRWEAARALMRSPDFPYPGLRVALPLGPHTLARLRSRTGGAGGPGPQPAPLVAAEVAAHSKAAGSLAEWLLGAGRRELSRAALEAEAAHACDWPQRLLRRSTGGQAGTAGSSTDASAAAPALGSAVRDAFRASRKLAAYQQRVTHLTVRFVFHFKHIDALIAAAAPRAPRLPPLPAGASAAAVLAAVESWVQQVRQVFDLEELVSVSCLSEIEREWATAWKPVMMKLDRLGRLLY